ncbi:O-antigen ligase [Sporosarcina sp. 6E9]|uniref:O-antigen ligase family protein n=1 Tax=Sporosarcina sp. 6E9 TaxID=2819235 RepID=UPI001B3074EC|nr:O-antigen ligase family protein [Sporosarcina sp. 6E9]
MTDNIRKKVANYLFLAMIVSSFVLFEPAPYDLLMILFIIAGFLFSFYKFTKSTFIPLLTICIFLVSNVLSLFFIEKIGVSYLFTGITFYLALTWVAFVGVGQYLRHENVQWIIKGYLISACISAGIGILAYLQVLPNEDLFLMYGRAKALFKDPNVFGPFLVMPALFAIAMTESREATTFKKMVYFLSFLVLTTGIVVSFSRAAWGNYAISLLLFLFILKREFIKKRIKTFTLLLLVGIPALIYFIQTPIVEDLIVSRLSYQNYDNDRFDTQRAAFTTGLLNPFGVGSGQSDSVFQYSPHSLYARVFTENGVVGFLSLVVLVLISIIKAYQSYWASKDEDGNIYLVIFAALIGLAFNSLFVDTLHWRNFWFLLALAWVPIGSQVNRN